MRIAATTAPRLSCDERSWPLGHVVKLAFTRGAVGAHNPRGVLFGSGRACRALESHDRAAAVNCVCDSQAKRAARAAPEKATLSWNGRHPTRRRRAHSPRRMKAAPRGDWPAHAQRRSKARSCPPINVADHAPQSVRGARRRGKEIACIRRDLLRRPARFRAAAASNYGLILLGLFTEVKICPMASCRAFSFLALHRNGRASRPGTVN